MVYKNDGKERLVKGHSGQLFLLLTFMLICLQLTQRLLPPLLPIIVEDLGITALLAGISLTLLRVARASMEYPSGRYADNISRTIVILISLILVIIGVTILLVSSTFTIFLISLLIFGMGLGLFGPASRAMLADVFQKKRGRAFGIHLVGSDLPGVIAAVFAIWIVSIYTWRTAFLPLLMALLPLPVIFIYISKETTHIEDLQLRQPSTKISIIGNGFMKKMVLVYTIFVLSSSAVMSFLPLFLIEFHGFSYFHASLSFALVYTIGILIKPLSGVASDISYRPTIAYSAIFTAAAGLTLMVSAPYKTIVVLGIIIFSVGQRAVPPVLQAFLMDEFPDKSMGSDLGAMRTVYLTLGSFGPAYTGFIVSTLGFAVAFVSIVIFFIFCGIILFWVTQ